MARAEAIAKIDAVQRGFNFWEAGVVEFIILLLLLLWLLVVVWEGILLMKRIGKLVILILIPLAVHMMGL